MEKDLSREFHDPKTASIDETNNDTQSFTILIPRCAGNVPTWNPPSFAEEAYHGWTAEESNLRHAFRLIPFALFLVRMEDELQNRSSSGYPSDAMRWIN